jgi:hypothetical protein
MGELPRRIDGYSRCELGSGERFHFEDADSPDNSFIRSVDLKRVFQDAVPGLGNGGG